jgi:hypothetical protein
LFRPVSFILAPLDRTDQWFLKIPIILKIIKKLGIMYLPDLAKMRVEMAGEQTTCSKKKSQLTTS